MRKKIIVLIILGIFLFLPALVLADCADLGRYTNWVLESEHKIIFYMGVKPIARLEIPDCKIQSSSNLRLLKGYVCESDEIMIDGNTCNIMSLEILY